MSYLARLKLLDSEKNFTHTPETDLTKPTEGAFVSYGSTLHGHIEVISSAKKSSVSFVGTAPAHIEEITPSKNDDDFRPDSSVARSIFITEPSDNLRYCTQCQNLGGRVCSIAYPGGLVSAKRGYTPMRDTLHRCSGYIPNAIDKDQRSGSERWPGLTVMKETK